MEYYAVTIKKTTEWCIDYKDDIHDYEEWLRHAASCGLVFEKYCYEIDPKGVLHLHGIVKARANFYKKRLLKKGFHQQIDLLARPEDIVRWMIYMHKDYANLDLHHIISDQADPEFRRLRAEALYNNSRS